MLLGHAVHGAESPDEISGIDGHDLALGEGLSESVERSAVVWTIEDRDKHDIIRDIEICITGGQAASLENYRLRHGNFDDLKRLPRVIPGALQAT